MLRRLLMCLLLLLPLYVGCTQAIAQAPSQEPLSGPNREDLGPAMQGHRRLRWQEGGAQVGVRGERRLRRSPQLFSRQSCGSPCRCGRALSG